MTTDYSSFEFLEITQDGRLLSVALNRPDSLNAIHGPMHRELERVWPLISQDQSVGAVLFRGNGRAFCAGGDVKFMAQSSAGEIADISDAVGRTTALLDGPKTLVHNMLNLRQPLICAVHGYAMGLGASIALSSDIVLAAEDATFGDAHISIGLVPADGGTLLWPLLLPLNTAKYYLMTGDRVDSAEAHRLGLVQRVLPVDQLHPAAIELAQRLAHGPTLALSMTKLVLNNSVRERANAMLDTSLLLEAVTMSSADHRNATQAFADKQAPTFIGR